MNREQLDQVLADHKRWMDGEAGGVRANLRGIDLRYTNLRGTKLRGIDMRGTILYGADMRDVDMRDADMRDADLRRANMSGNDMRGSDMRGSDMRGTKLNSANMCGTNLEGTDLRDTNLCDADLNGVLGLSWAQAGPVGQGGILLTGWSHPSLDDVMISGGCFTSTIEDFRSMVLDADSPPWDWFIGTDDDRGHWRAECLAAADFIELVCQQ